MKRLIVIFTALCFALSGFALVGCGKKEEPTPETPEPIAPPVVKKTPAPAPVAPAVVPSTPKPAASIGTSSQSEPSTPKKPKKIKMKKKKKKKKKKKN